ncbi:sigma-70-like protein [Novosphingobium sp. PhB165]|uniref:sigma factor-like helix-turn-helix DNA-binding protein n=1 Tax=Novosphingobium sp. PhB165 TaxID=2485105 RepID=UPI00104F42A4|nr:sigma factor-like helix-turn-helix DNA-binding protein [Novosphingobium sp. PhB165]TCM18692.1 sigma-70-like protein [Novosphingobium sp. PhB165]
MRWHLYLLEQRIREAFLRHAFPEYEDPDLRRLARAVRSLPWLPRAVFHLLRFEGLRYEQIAERLGISTRRVEIEVGRAMGLIVRSRNRQERKGW